MHHILLVMTLSAIANCHSQELHFNYYFFEQSCFQTHFSKLDLSAPLQCYSLLFSRLFSLLILISCFVTRVPQIITNVRERSVAGLSFIGNNFQCLTAALTAAYGLFAQIPFSVYGQNYFLCLQSFTVLLLFFLYSPKAKSPMMAALFATVLISACFVGQILPRWILAQSMNLQLVAFLIARGSQLIENIRNKSTGTLSVASMAITVTNNLARAFSILMETRGQWLFLVANCLVPLAINVTILTQFYIYGGKGKKIPRDE